MIPSIYYLEVKVIARGVGVIQFPDVKMLEKANKEMTADAKKAS